MADSFTTMHGSTESACSQTVHAYAVLIYLSSGMRRGVKSHPLNCVHERRAEVNASPSLATDTPADYKLKSEMVRDVLDIVDLEGCRRGGQPPSTYGG